MGKHRKRHGFEAPSESHRCEPPMARDQQGARGYEIDDQCRGSDRCVEVALSIGFSMFLPFSELFTIGKAHR